MDHQASAALLKTLSPHLDLSKSRSQTLVLLVIGMISARTVNLSHLACELPGTALIASGYRRLQRFFQYVQLSSDWSAPVVMALIGVTGPWYLCLDRTNWKLGKCHINILMLAVVTRRFRVPLMWSVLGKAGNSNTGERIALMNRYLTLFDVSTVKMLLADREFIGGQWLEFLNKNNIPFAIRMKENFIITLEDGRAISLRTLLVKCRGVRHLTGYLDGHGTDEKPSLNFAARRIKGGELLIVASNGQADKALNAYKKRWAIECLFGDAKTRGLNLEDTHIVNPAKLMTLLAIVALALAWASKVASGHVGRGKLKRKTHGYPAKSWFRIGFDQIRKGLRTDPAKILEPWRKFRPKSLGVV